MSYEAKPFQGCESITLEALKDQADSLLNMVYQQRMAKRSCCFLVTKGMKEQCSCSSMPEVKNAACAGRYFFSSAIMSCMTSPMSAVKEK